MKVLLAGASGALGGPLMRRLHEAGHDVTGIVRSAAGARTVRARGGDIVVADVLDRPRLLSAIDGRRFDAVVHELTALKRAPARHSAMAETNRLRTEGSANLVEVAHAVGARRFVTQSIVFGYGYADHGDTVLTEAATFGRLVEGDFDPHVEAMVAAEHAARRSPDIEGVALRYGLFYGADVDRMERMLRRRSLPVVRGGGAIPFIHHEDAAAATVAALERGEPGAVYNVADDGVARFADLIRAVAAARSAPPPLTVPRRLLRLVAPYAAAVLGEVSMRVCTRRARTDLGWEPRYATVADGVAAS